MPVKCKFILFVHLTASRHLPPITSLQAVSYHKSNMGYAGHCWRRRGGCWGGGGCQLVYWSMLTGKSAIEQIVFGRKYFLFDGATLSLFPSAFWWSLIKIITPLSSFFVCVCKVMSIEALECGYWVTGRIRVCWSGWLSVGEIANALFCVNLGVAMMLFLFKGSERGLWAYALMT